MNRIAVLTSGGDAPGMNDAIRGVVRTALQENLQVIGFRRGFSGLINNEYIEMDHESVGSILEEGGTILGTFRSEEFRTDRGQETAVQNLENLDIDGLVVIGGDGSFRGAQKLDQRWDGSIVGIPATIDNDISGTDICLGFDTATNTCLNALDNIRNTATSHERTFILEVMGRDSGHLALAVGLAGGAEEILVPERNYEIDSIARRIQQSRDRGKLHYIIVLAEGAGKAHKLSESLQDKNPMETRVAVLGHVQRGGRPTCADRMTGGRMGHKAIEALLDGVSGSITAMQCNAMKLLPFDEALQEKQIDEELLSVADCLST